MRIHGIHYDIGTDTLAGALTRPSLPAAEVARDMDMIAHELHANAVRISGRDSERIAMAGELAAERGLEIWLSPFLVNGSAEDTLALVAETAATGERIRNSGAEVVMVVGCEWSVFLAGILPGDDIAERFSLLSDPARLMPAIMASGVDPQTRMTEIMNEAIETTRSQFAGQVTYAAGVWEHVDWSPFDIVGIDAYRDASNRDSFAADLQARAQTGTPVVVTESGCATFRGSPDLGGLAWTAIDRAARPSRLKPDIVRDESVQASEVSALLEIFETSGVDGAFVYTLIAPSYSGELDAASYALVRSEVDGGIERKRAFHAVAEFYQRND